MDDGRRRPPDGTGVEDDLLICSDSREEARER